MRLSYSLAVAAAECGRKGITMRKHRMPDPTGEQALRILRGHTLDRVVGQAFEEKWWETRPSAADIEAATMAAQEWCWMHYLPISLTAADKVWLRETLTPTQTLVDQIEQFDLVPVDVRVQPYLERQHDEKTTLTGVADVMVLNTRLSVVDVKAGTYRSSKQLSWYLLLLEAYGLVPNRIGFWHPLFNGVGKIDWKTQSRLPDVSDIIENALRVLDIGNADERPGGYCDMCALLRHCQSGIRYTNRLAHHPHLAVGSAVSNVGFGGSRGNGQ